MFYDILDKKRKEILPFFRPFKKDFYLAGGTALALQLGHRDSVDFDFFTQNNFSPSKQFAWIKEGFHKQKIKKIQEDKNTLTVIINEFVKVSFFSYDYKLINKPVMEPFFRLASIEDVACMKLSAIIGRATVKDYIDLYFVLKKVSLKTLLKYAEEKFPDIDTNLILKSLVYFKDIEKEEPIIFKHGHKVSFKEVETTLERAVSGLC